MIGRKKEGGRRPDGGDVTEFLGHLMSVALDPRGLITWRKREERWHREEDNEIEVGGITVHFKG